METQTRDELPLISVVIPVFNRRDTIRRSVASVLYQDIKEIEVLVVDDGSSDGTLGALADFDDARLKLITHGTNKGVSAARNTGIRAARGQFVAFQDSDDEWLYGKLRLQLEAFKRSDHSCVMVYCTKIVYGRDPQRNFGKRLIACVPPAYARKLEGDMKNIVVDGTYASPQTMLVKTDALMEIDGFDERLFGSEEWDLAFRLAQIGTFCFVDEPLVSTYLQSDSISVSNPRAAYSLLRIANKMKKAGIEPERLALHWSQLGTMIARAGRRARGRILIRSAIKAHPLSLKNWARLLLSYAR